MDVAALGQVFRAILTTGPTITNDQSGRIAAILPSNSMSNRSSITP